MKKVLLGIVTIICITFVTGCGNSIKTNSNKTLSCTKDFSSSMPSGITMIQKSDISFTNNKIDTIDMLMSFEVSDTYLSQFDTLMDTMKTTYDEQYGKYDGVTVETNKTSDSTFEVTISVDYKNTSDSTRTALDMKGSEDYKINKTQLEQQGYTCE